MMKWIGLFVFLLASAPACASGKKVAIDPVTASTILDGDSTSLVEGCGNNPQVGFTYCRKVEGDNAGQSISFIGPPSKCNQETGCVFIKVYNQNGTLVWGDSIPKKQTRVNIDWKTLLGRNEFQMGDRGFWTWTTNVFWLDPDGRERNSSSQGDIVLRVFRKGYIPLHEVENDPAFVWQWNDQNCTYKMTSGLRAFIKCLH